MKYAFPRLRHVSALARAPRVGPVAHFAAPRGVTPAPRLAQASFDRASFARASGLSRAFGCALTLAFALLSSGSPPARAAGPGETLPREFRVNAYTLYNQTAPAVTVDADGDLVIVWMSVFQDDVRGGDIRGGIYAQRYAADGTAQGGEFRVNAITEGFQGEQAVAMDAGGGFVGVWEYLMRDGERVIYARRFAADGTPRGGEFRVNATTAGDTSEPAVATDPDGNFVVAWQSFGQDGSGSGVYARRFAADGTAHGNEFRVNATTARFQGQPAVAVDGAGNFVVAWASYGQDAGGLGVYARRYGADGRPRGGEFRVNTVTAGDQHSPVLAVAADGGLLVAWVDGAGGGARVHARRYDADGAPRGGAFAVGAAPGGGLLGHPAGRQGQSTGLQSQSPGRADLPAGLQNRSTGGQSHPAVAVSADGGFVIAWQGGAFPARPETPATGFRVYARRYGPDGAPRGEAFHVRSTATAEQRAPAVALSAAGDLVVAWTGGEYARYTGPDGSGTAVYARRYPAVAARTTAAAARTTSLSTR